MAYSEKRPSFLGYLFRLIFMLLILGLLGLVAFAYFGDIGMEPEPRSIPIDLDAN